MKNKVSPKKSQRKKRTKYICFRMLPEGIPPEDQGTVVRKKKWKSGGSDENVYKITLVDKKNKKVTVRFGIVPIILDEDEFDSRKFNFQEKKKKARKI